MFRATAWVLWPAGRDGALALLGGDTREEALRRLKDVMGQLIAYGHDREAASCLTRAAPKLSDGELVEQLQALESLPRILTFLPVDLSDRALAAARQAQEEGPHVDTARVLGHLLADLELRTGAAAQTDQADVSQGGDESRALRYARSHGTDTAAGIAYEAQYALWRLLTDPDIIVMGLQDLEDVKLVHLDPGRGQVTEHVQAKKRDDDWSVPDLQSRGKSANHVFDSFAEVLLAEPDARLTFATDARLGRGNAPSLVRAAAKLREIASDPARLATVQLVDIALTKGEEEVLAQLKSGIRADLLQQVDLHALLGRVSFDQGRTRRELRSEVIRRLSAMLNVPDPAAEGAYHALVGLLLEEMETRREFSRADIEALVAAAGARARALRDAGVPGGRAEVLDFDRLGGASAERFYQGLSASPADIAAGLDALRPRLLAEIRSTLIQHQCCIIRAPSGQGKTTLLYRFAYEVADDFLLVRVHGLDHAAVSEIARVIEPLRGIPVLVLVDDIAAGARDQWPDALRRLLEQPQVRVLATSREDDWRLATVPSIEGLVRFVYPRLDEHTAESVFSALSRIDGLRLHADHWRDPFAQADGLLMEYVHLLTQGRRMRDVIAEQIAGLERQLDDRAAPVIAALQYITMAHRYSGYLSLDTLTRLVPAAGHGLGRALQVLEAEFWIRDEPAGRYAGVHRVRSGVVSDILHERDPITETVSRLLHACSTDEVASFAEDLIYLEASMRAQTLEALAERASSDGPRFAARAIAAAYAAEERRYADEVFGLLQDVGRTAANAHLATWATLPRPIDVSAVVRLIPSAGRLLATALLERLPVRRYADRAEARLVEAIGTERLAPWMASEAEPGDAVEMLSMLAIVAPEFGRGALSSAGTTALAERVLGDEGESAQPLLEAVRSVAPTMATEVAQHVGAERLTQLALTTIEGCYAVAWDGETIRGQFLARMDGEGDSVNDAAVRITRGLYSLFPSATASEVTGYVWVGVPHPEGQKRIPRENLPLPDLHVLLNRYWLSLAADRLGARSSAFVVQLHDAYGEALLAALRASYQYLDTPGMEHRQAAIDAWGRVGQLARSMPTMPHRTGPLGSAERADATDMTGSPQAETHPLDRAFGEVSGAADNAGREFQKHSAGGRPNAAILSDQLARIHRGAPAYLDLRESSGLLDDGETLWRIDLPTFAAKVRQGLDVVARPRVHRAKALHLYEGFAGGRALLRDLANEWSAAGGDCTGLRLWPERVAALRALVTQLTREGPGWQTPTDLAAAVEALERSAHILDGGEPAEADPRAVAARLEAVLPLDAEVWLAEADAGAEREELQRATQAALGQRGVDATCCIVPPSLDEPLFGHAVLAARIADLRDAEGVQETVREVAFAALPHPVSRLILLFSHREDEVLPMAAQTWRGSDAVANPYSQMLGLGQWLPLAEASPAAERMQLQVDRRAHPVADQIARVRDQHRRLNLAFGHFSAVVAAVAPGWEVDVRALAGQTAEVAAAVEAFVGRVQNLGMCIDEHPDWESTIVLVIDAVSRHFEWLMRVARNEPDIEEALGGGYDRLTEAWASVDNKLFMDLDPPARGQASIEEAVERLSEALARFLSLWQDLTRELTATAAQ